MGAFSSNPDLVGDANLRAVIAGWLSTSRGLAVTPDQVILTNDRSQALHLVAHLTLRPGARVVVEAPSQDIDTAAYSAEWAELVEVAVDAEGICTSKLPFGRTALVHVSTEHQRLLGAWMSPNRRQALLDWAAQSEALVLEDDTQSELHYGEKSTPRLFSLDLEGRVILLGGFCVSLGPWVHLAYLVVPHRLIDAATAARRMLGDESAQLHQVALHELLSSGWYARHLYRLCKSYAVRRDALVAALHAHFPQRCVIWGEQAGLHVAWFAHDEMDASLEIAAFARRCGLEAKAVQTAGPSAKAVVLLGFGLTAEHLIESKVARLADMVAHAIPHVLAAE
jgi:GntR family transcriptional regulator/MocR family aminotransferase